MAGIRKWKQGTQTHVVSFRLPTQICPACLLDEIWDHLPHKIQEEILKKYPELVKVGEVMHTCRSGK